MVSLRVDEGVAFNFALLEITLLVRLLFGVVVAVVLQGMEIAGMLYYYLGGLVNSKYFFPRGR